MGPSARSIIELNIQYYRGLLKIEIDPSKRRTIAELLAEEETKLTKLIAEQQSTEGTDEPC